MVSEGTQPWGKGRSEFAKNYALGPAMSYTMRAAIVAYVIYSEGPEYPEYVIHFLLKVFWDPQISEYVRQSLPRSVFLSK